MEPLNALLRLVALEHLPRTGWLQAGISPPESVAAHALGTTLVALSLGPRVEPPLDVDRAASLCALHDAPEALLGDLPKRAGELLGRDAKRRAEARAAEELLAPLSALAHERWTEYQAQETPEARFAKACDGLHLGLRLLAYRRAGWDGLEDFERTLEALDCRAFPPCEELRTALLHELRRNPRDGAAP